MTAVVLDTSALLALIRDEAGADKVARHIGRAAISAVNLQEVVGELLLSGLDDATIRELLGELRLDVRPHDTAAAYAAAALHGQMRDHGLGDRSCLALAMQLGVPALTAHPAWRQIRIEKLTLEHIR